MQLKYFYMVDMEAKLMFYIGQIEGLTEGFMKTLKPGTTPLCALKPYQHGRRYRIPFVGIVTAVNYDFDRFDPPIPTRKPNRKIKAAGIT